MGSAGEEHKGPGRSLTEVALDLMLKHLGKTGEHDGAEHDAPDERPQQVGEKDEDVVPDHAHPEQADLQDGDRGDDGAA
jgi:hypothetical protein